MADQDKAFAFGKNWDDFIRTAYSDERVEKSKEHLLCFLRCNDLRGRYFLDVGCGSGLSSLAALRAGAERIVSFDVDPDSVATTQRLWSVAGRPAHWTVLQGSVLDAAFLARLEPADIAYSWGVLHHTGSMWQAIENVLPLVKAHGVLYIALYTTSPLSPFWIRVKQSYNAASQFGKRRIEAWYLLRFVLWPHLKARRNPFKFMAGRNRRRGMAFMTDVRDWLGGWPYEDASIEEVQQFIGQRGLRQINIATGQANTEYLFEPAQNAL